MANVVIRLVVNRETGKKDVIISYASEADALPMEHEDQHRSIVDKLLAGGALKEAELGNIVVVREELGASKQSDAEDKPIEERQVVPAKG